MGRPTLKDVATEAGVSPITVSRVLRSTDGYKVSSKLRARVKAAVAKLGYVPNISASTLASKRSNLVVVLIPSISNHVFTDVLTGISDGIEGTPLVLQIGNTLYNPAKEEKILRSVLNPPPAGIILTGLEQSQATKDILEAQDVPIIHIMDIEGDRIGAAVGFSHEKAAHHATQHLIQVGYRNIGFLGAQMDPRTRKRMAGFKSAIEGATDVIGDVTTSLSSSNPEKGAELLSRHIANFPDCDAVMCVNEDIALGALFECKRRGIDVPADFGICGFNDLGFSSVCVPSVTTITTPLYEIGKSASELLRTYSDDKKSEVVDLGFFLSVRESTRRHLQRNRNTAVDEERMAVDKT